MSFIRSVLVLSSAAALCFSAQAFAVENTSSTAENKTTSAVVTEKVNLNSATVEQLDALKGVGKSKAQAIVDYRTANGPFKSVDDLANVKGFSSKVVANLVSKNPGLIVVE